ncbi:MAG TPA: hypothetical protein VHO25_18355, partial [Polyangiaceae bacterium]|nr:hypothetical protein [Polyangiaceae bacterium]
RYATTSPGTCNDTFGTRAPGSGGDDLGSGLSSVGFSEGITGLVPNTTYYVCAIAENSTGKAYGGVNSFTTPIPPTAVTSAATNLGNNSARLNGSGIPNRAATTGWFRFSSTNPVTCDDSFGSRAPSSGGTAMGSGTSTVNFFENVSGLSASTTYYFCAITENSEGKVFGSVLSFTTLGPPIVTTNAVTALTGVSATLNGSANPNGATSTGWFRYATVDPVTCNNTFGTQVPGFAIALGAGVSNVPYSTAISSLTPNTTYYYCALANNGYGTTMGAVVSFTTPAMAPTTSTHTYSLVTGTSATLHGYANPGGAATTGWFRYSAVSPGTCNDSFGTRAPSSGGTDLGSSGVSNVFFSEAITGLSQNTTYYFCAIAENSVGKTFGSVSQFTTAMPPTAVTSAATNIGNNTARLNGSGNPNRAAATGWFRYDTVNPVTCNDTFGTRAPGSGGTDLGSGTSSVNFLQNISGLSPVTTYYFCAITENGEGKTFGSVLSFTTLGPPVATTGATSALTATSVTMHTEITPNGSVTTGWVRYSTTDPGTCNNSFGTQAPVVPQNFGGGFVPVAFTPGASGLTPNTTYYYCALANNAYGTSFGAVASFTTLPAAPTVSTNSATLITGSSAQLNGNANPGGATTTGWFRYATVSPGTCNDTFGTRAPSSGGDDLGSGNSSVPFSEGITGLTQNTTYYYCAIAENSVNKTFGSVVSFTTPMPPTAVTSAATSITNTTVRLNGTGIPNRATTTGWFRYSSTNPVTCDDSFGSRAPSSGGTAMGSGTSTVNFFENISGLSESTTYYFCAITENGEGKAFGSVLSFTTLGPPVVTTNAETLLTATSATLNGSVNPSGAAATGWFRYATVNPGTCNDTFGTRLPFNTQAGLGSGTSSVAYSFPVTGLTPVTTYYYCAIANNGYGTRFGAVVSFTTPPALPTAALGGVNPVTGTAATIHGQSIPGGAAATGWFRYSTASPGTCNDTFGIRAPSSSGDSLGSGLSTVSFDEAITGLTPNTTYYYCVIAESSAGKTVSSSVGNFTTPIPPTAVTAAVTNLFNTSVTLNGSGIPNRATTTGWFRYSPTNPVTCDDSFGSRAPISGGTNLSAGTTSVNF